MPLKSLLVANRGEIAVRVMRAAAELGIRTVAVYSEDDARSLHTRRADELRPLRGSGVAAYLDGGQLVEVAQAAGCDAVHPGYGFLSEDPAFAQRCADAGITFVGPSPETLELFGDKARARGFAGRCGVPVLPGTVGPTTLDEARDFLASLGGGAILIKAVVGGGGRGMREVRHPDELEQAFARCASEAETAFGRSDLYVEKLLPRARHVEVQVIGDGSGETSHIWERECSLQRRHQKLVEIAPCPALDPALRDRLTAAAVRLAEEACFRSLGTFEFLIGATDDDGGGTFAFMEVNPRLQVEHAVTEEVTGIDLVKAQLEVAAGRSLAEIGLLQADIAEPSGFAVQVRINMETVDADGTTRPSGGTLTAFEPPSGPGLRTDTFGYAGYKTSPSFDSLLAKLVARTPSGGFAGAVNRVYRGLCEFRIEGVKTNIPFLQNLLRHPDLTANRIHTRFVDDHIDALVGTDGRMHQRLYFDRLPIQTHTGAGAQVDDIDPLAILDLGQAAREASIMQESADAGTYASAFDMAGMEGTYVLEAPMQGTIASIAVAEGDGVTAGREILAMNAMKMEHVIRSSVSGIVRRLAVAVGDTVYEGHPLAFIEEREIDESGMPVQEEIDLDHIRPDLEEVIERHKVTLDAARPEAVAKRRKIGQRTARENIEDLCDPGTFTEYGGLVIAAQRRRRSMEDLIQNTPTDGMIAGIGGVNGDLFGDEKSRCVIVAYDYMVLAGTQGHQNHRKKDRVFEIAAKSRLPVVLFSEGGGGRPGDTDSTGVAGQDVMAFHLFAKLSALVPLVGVNAGRCFAGNALLLGCCDVIIAKENSSIGMGGPVMIEGGSLGVFTPEEVGPMSVQVPNGVVDIPVKDEAEAVQAAKKYLSYFQGAIGHWECSDQRLLRRIIPENRLRTYDVRSVIEIMADSGSVLELRRHYGVGIVTALVRIEGRPLGVIANNPNHLSGAIDSPGSDKAARFMQLCDAFDIPILFLSDCPGIMVGPEIERTALVRHSCRMFVVGANLTVPYFTIVMRKSYGLGAQAMQGGSSHAPLFTVSWPTGEFGGMGLEGAVKLGYRKELMAIEDPVERKREFDKRVAAAYEHGKAISMASYFEIDDVIDPAESRAIIVRALKSAPPPLPRAGKKRPNIDTW